MENNPEKCWYVKTKSGACYRIQADYVKQEFSDEECIITFKKTNPDKINPETNDHEFDVAFMYAKDIEIIGHNKFIFDESIPKTETEWTNKIAESVLKIGTTFLVFALVAYIKK